MQLGAASHLPKLLGAFLTTSLLGCASAQSGSDAPEGPIRSPEWSEARARATEPEVRQAPRAQACSGTTLDASVLSRSGLCNVEGNSKPLPANVHARLASETVEVVSGQTIDVIVELTNQGAAPADLFLDHSCGFENLITKTVRDDGGNRLDRVGRGDCPLDDPCAGGVAHLTLAAGGVARIALPLQAAVSVIGDDCEELSGRALSPGRYFVEWKTPYTSELLTSRLQVVKLERLDESECKEYARVVAAKAEPDIKLRRGVERDLLARCEISQPSRAFADCQMNSKSELELANCQEMVLPR